MRPWFPCLAIAAVAAVAAIPVAGPTLRAAERPPGATERYGDQKVVYHVDFEGGEGAKAYARVLTNVQNHLEAVGRDHVKVAVVMHGEGLDLLREAKAMPKLQTNIRALKAQGVLFDVCNNTLVNRKIDYERDLFEVSKDDIVPSGVAELSRLQQMGYTYIRP